MKERILQIHKDIYPGHNRIRSFFSPGRVNLIGEHIDYNGGFVFPTAISLGTYGAIAKNNDKSIRLYSDNYPQTGIVHTDLTHLDYRSDHGWANYAKGIIRELLKRGCIIDEGFDIAITGDLPIGSGLSSSAATEVLIVVMMNELFDLNIPRPDLALLAKAVENEYMHVNCGIMDQFVIACGRKGHALLLDTETLDYKEVPLHLGQYEIVICNSMKKRELVESRYNERRAECEQALTILNEYTSARNLCEISYPEFVELEDKLPDKTLRKRVKHVITENLRTISAYDLLHADNLAKFGKTMLESHYSLKEDYEVSCPELDTLVELAMNNGSIGSRMTGAGFGGSTVNIVKYTDFASFKNNVQNAYQKKYGVICDIIHCDTADGTRETTD